MTERTGTGAAPTRRDYVTYVGAVLASGSLAGCTGSDGESGDRANSSNDTGTETTTAGTERTTNETAGGTTAEGGDGSYSVTMSPVGTVEFDGAPGNVLVYSLLYADMAVAYGHGEAVNSLGFDAEAGGDTLDAYYARLDGMSFDREGLAQLNTGSGDISVDRELVYELDSDLHLADPCLVLSFDGWERADVEEVRRNVAPWFGNTYSRAHSQPPAGCAENYRYYTLWEIAEKVASVFRERRRFEELRAVHRGLLERIQSNLPPKDERPTVGSVVLVDGTFYPSKSTTPGFGNAHVRPLRAPDAFAAEDVTYETTYDYETMLDIGPDVILHQFAIASYYDVTRIRKTLEGHPIGSELAAVTNDRVYPSGNPVQGPLMNLFQLEMTAKQLYPEQFGEWPRYGGGAYPEIPESERLFDRERVGAIVEGDV